MKDVVGIFGDKIDDEIIWDSLLVVEVRCEF